MTTPTTYTRPELTKDDSRDAMDRARKLIVKYGVSNFGKIIAALCVENVRLVKEIQEHRAARGIDPLETYEV